MLTIENLNQYYGGSHILRGLSFEVPTGKVTALLGRNGVGKTTLLKTLMGLVPAASGSVRFGGTDLTRAPSHARVRAGIGYVPQGREIFPRLTVEENLLMGLATRPRGSAIPARAPSITPSRPRTTCSTSGELGSIVIRTSDWAATSRGEVPALAPALTRSSTAARLRLWTTRG